MSTISDFLFGSNPTPQVSSSSSTTTWPSWYQQWYNQLLTKGSQVANQPYVANPNQRVAGLTQNQNAAYNTVAGMQGAYQPTLNTATGFAQTGGSPINASTLQNYMSPYTQNVVNTIGSLAGRNLSENLLPAVNDTFTGAGQFGSTRHRDFTERAVRDANESALNQQSQALESGYGTALNAYQNDLQRQLSAAGTLGSLASTGQTLGLQGAAAQEAAGQAQQQNTQQNLDVANQDWLAQQQYPQTQLSWLSGLLSQSPPTSTTQTSSSTPSVQKSSPLSQLVGSIGGIGSLIGSLFAEGGEVAKPNSRRAKGRALPNYRRGGSVASLGALRMAA